MKIFLKLFLVIFCVASAATAVFSKETPAITMHSGVYDQAGELISVDAKGLVCEFCAKALEKVMMRQAEVSGVRVDLTTKEILISLKEGMTIGDERLEGLIIDAGYNVGEIRRNTSKGQHETSE